MKLDNEGGYQCDILYNPDRSNITMPDGNGACIHKNVKLSEDPVIVIYGFAFIEVQKCS